MLMFLKCVGLCLGSFFFFLASGCPVDPAPLVEETVFALLCCLCSFFKDQLTGYMEVYVQALYFVPLIYLHILFPILHYPD